MPSDKVYSCPLCGSGTVGISQEQADALEVGKALGAMGIVDVEQLGVLLAEVIGKQVADVLADYSVELVRKP